MATKKTTTRKAKILYHEGVGRRKEASCRVRLYVPTKEGLKAGKVTLEKGKTNVNGIDIAKYFVGENKDGVYRQPFVLTKTLERFAVVARVAGGGKSGQLTAFTLACARALQKADESYRAIMKPAGLLTVDARVKERRKAGFGGKARRKRQSPKR